MGTQVVIKQTSEFTIYISISTIRRQKISIGQLIKQLLKFFWFAPPGPPLAPWQNTLLRLNLKLVVGNVSRLPINCCNFTQSKGEALICKLSNIFPWENCSEWFQVFKKAWANLSKYLNLKRNNCSKWNLNME